MKRLLIICAVMLGAMGTMSAQKIGYVDTETILNKIPAYKTAQTQLENLSQQYQKEIEAGYQKVEELFKAYQADRVLLTEDMRKRREEEILKREKDMKDLQQKYFGQDGTLSKKSEELLKPIQDRVMTAIKDIANADGYAMIIDVANNPSIIFTAPRYDISDKVISKLGYK